MVNKADNIKTERTTMTMKISPGFGQAEKYSEEYQSNNLGSIDRQ
jgi:hypothetical protein